MTIEITMNGLLFAILGVILYTTCRAIKPIPYKASGLWINGKRVAKDNVKIEIYKNTTLLFDGYAHGAYAKEIAKCGSHKNLIIFTNNSALFYQDITELQVIE